mmetsp:Transcript_8303/g.37841  ORF Transcript_8303/g.37841 Transcript_8303/m.37841 type:complete len:220 (-) Transcript_8303:806-1465(-)
MPLRRVTRVLTWQKSRDTCAQGEPAITGLHSMRITSRRASTYFSKRGLSAADSCLARVSSHESTMGFQPSSVSETKMIPARDTVAGDALLRFSGSNIAFMIPLICTRSPLARVRTLLSSSTVLRFSIQMASTGPSSTIQVLFFFSFAARRHSTAKTPSVQSPVAASRRPNICGAVIALGFIFQTTCLLPTSVRAPASVSQMAVLPLPVGPTSMIPWRTR